MNRTGFTLKRGLTGFPKFQKKGPPETYLEAFNVAQNIALKDNFFFKAQLFLELSVRIND